MRIVVNGDDFGLTSSLTEGMLHCLREKYISDVSLIANGAAAGEALEGLRKLGRTSVGVHLTAVDGEAPLSPADEIAALLGPEGRFHQSRNSLFFRAALWSDKVRRQLSREFERQIKSVIAAGFRVTHLDSHQHVHVFSPLQEVVIGLARAFDVPFVRAPRLMGHGAAGAVCNRLSEGLREKLSKAGIRCLPFGLLDRKFGPFAPQLASIGASLGGAAAVEIMTHPGRADAATRTRYAHWNYDWDGSLASLSEDPFLEKRKEFEMVSFEDLASQGTIRA